MTGVKTFTVFRGSDANNIGMRLSVAISACSKHTRQLKRHVMRPIAWRSVGVGIDREDAEDINPTAVASASPHNIALFQHTSCTGHTVEKRAVKCQREHEGALIASASLGAER